MALSADVRWLLSLPEVGRYLRAHHVLVNELREALLAHGHDLDLCEKAMAELVSVGKTPEAILLVSQALGAPSAPLN